MAALGLGDYGSDDDEEHMSEDGVQDLAGDVQGLTVPPNQFTTAPDVDIDNGIGPQGSDEARPQGEDADRDAGQPPSSQNTWNRLPPELRQPPPGEHSPAAESRLHQIASAQQTMQRSFIESLRNNRNYSNPDLLQQLMQIYNLKGSGTAFSPEVFDPDSLPKSDYASALVKQLEREQEARRNARANAPPGAAVIQFERGHGSAGVLPASRSATDLHAAAAPGPAGYSTVGASLINVAALREQVAKNAAALAAAGVSGRKSKWDNR